jgi:molybdopterin molybdotransferase
MFKKLMGAKEVLETLLAISKPIMRLERVPVKGAFGRVLSEGIVSTVDLPEFNRAAMDGFAVKSSDTRGASPMNPVYLHLDEDCMQVRTGMAVADNYDAVVMLEDALLCKGQLEVTAEVHPFRNVSRIGEDIAVGDLILKEGHRLRPPDIALLAALGVKEVCVYARPKIAIIPTGGELVTIDSRKLKPGEAYEINGLMAELYIEKWGGLPLKHQIVPDDPELIREAIESKLEADMIVLIGGTSVGEKDYAPLALADLGDLLVHGVRLQPGKPTAFGRVKDKVVICLPGYPVAAFSALYLFVRPALKRLAHLDDAMRKITATLSRKVVSRPGYLSIVRVKMEGDTAMPIMTSGAGILSSISKADGFVTVPEELEGIEAGESVEVTMIE